MTRSSFVMAAVATVAAVGGFVLLARPVTTEAGVYRRRIFGTMLLAAALILALFAWGLTQVSVAP